MQTPPQIQFQGMKGTPAIEAAMANHAAELEKQFGRITACRVLLKAPSKRHRTSGLYEVHIRVALPEAFSRVRVGSRVTFAEEHGDKAPQATTVKLLGTHGLRP